jgi:hypothetical protein
MIEDDYGCRCRYGYTKQDKYCSIEITNQIAICTKDYIQPYFFQVFLFAAAELAVVVPTDKLQNDCDKIYYRIPK